MSIVVIDDAPGQFVTNRVANVSTRGERIAVVAIPGPTRNIAIRGDYYFFVDALRSVCLESAYDDIGGTALGLTRLAVTHRYFIRRGEFILWSTPKYTRTLLVPTGPDAYVSVSVSRNLHVDLPEEGLEDFEVGIEILSVVDQCGDVLEPFGEMIDLSVGWSKLPSNVCLPCLLPQGGAEKKK